MHMYMYMYMHMYMYMYMYMYTYTYAHIHLYCTSFMYVFSSPSHRQVAFGNSTGMPVVLLSTLAPSLMAEGPAIIPVCTHPYVHAYIRIPHP